MGHKWLWNKSLGGLPPEDFLVAVDPQLKGVREKLNGRYATSDELAGTLSGDWAAKLGLRCGIPIPVGAFDAHWDAIGAGARTGDIVNVVGTSTCIIAMSDEMRFIPGVCGVVRGSVHPKKTGVEAGLSATGDIFEAIARRAGTTVPVLSQSLGLYRPGQTGLLRLTWDNGDRTVLVNPELGGITLGWNLANTPQDELFAAIEGTAFHTRVILERMEKFGVPTRRVINSGASPKRTWFLTRFTLMSSISLCSFHSPTLPALDPPFLQPSRLVRSEPSSTPRRRSVQRTVSSSQNPKQPVSTRIFTRYTASFISHLETPTLQQRKSEVF